MACRIASNFGTLFKDSFLGLTITLAPNFFDIFKILELTDVTYT